RVDGLARLQRAAAGIRDHQPVGTGRGAGGEHQGRNHPSATRLRHGLLPPAIFTIGNGVASWLEILKRALCLCCGATSLARTSTLARTKLPRRKLSTTPSGP